jgi:hypothetical protein
LATYAGAKCKSGASSSKAHGAKGAATWTTNLSPKAAPLEEHYCLNSTYIITRALDNNNNNNNNNNNSNNSNSNNNNTQEQQQQQQHQQQQQ